MTAINKKYIAEGFEQKLLDAAIYNLKDTGNALRFNNFAYSIRELSRHILHRLSPDDEVKNCSWYKQTSNDKSKITITRGDRADYAIRGGFDNNQLNSLGLQDEIKAIKSKLKKTIDQLSEYTHINPDTFGLTDNDIEAKAADVISVFNDFFNEINSTRNTLIDKLKDQIDREVMDETLYNTNSDIDCTATHASIEEYEIQKITITNITSINVEIEVYGDVDVRQQYGSDGDQVRGDGYVTNITFPFKAVMQAPITKKLKFFKIDGDISFEVDTSPFYYYDDEEIERCIEQEINNNTMMKKTFK